MSLPSSNEILPSHVLVVGIDASGKSTLLEGMSGDLGYTLMEPTGTPTAREFKRTSIDRAVDEAFISERESIFLTLNNQFDTSVEAALLAGQRIATTGGSVVTRLSHAVMRQTIGIDVDVRKTILGQQFSDANPAAIVFTYAPFDTILARIKDRLNEGDELERFWGFNAPFFLERYQEAWHDAIEVISGETDVSCLLFDTTIHDPVTMLQIFKQNFKP